MPIDKNGQKEHLENYRPVSLSSVLGKDTEQIILSAISQHTQDNQHRIKPSQLFVKSESCSTALASFYDKVMHSVNEGKAVDFVC